MTSLVILAVTLGALALLYALACWADDADAGPTPYDPLG